MAGDALRVLPDEGAPGRERQVIDRRMSACGVLATPVRLEPSREEGGFERIARSLTSGTVDLAVCRASELPLELPDSVVVGAMLRTHDPEYVCASSRRPPVLGLLPAQSTVLTTDPVGRAQILHLYPWLFVEVATFGGDLDSGTSHDSWDALCLSAEQWDPEALAGARAEPVSSESVMPPVGQGVVCLLAASGNERALGPIRLLHDRSVASSLETERTFLRAMLDRDEGVLCTARASRIRGRSHVRGVVVERDGAWLVTEHSASGGPAEALAREVADLCRLGARRSRTAAWTFRGGSRS